MAIKTKNPLKERRVFGLSCRGYLSNLLNREYLDGMLYCIAQHPICWQRVQNWCDFLGGGIMRACMTDF